MKIRIKNTKITTIIIGWIQIIGGIYGIGLMSRLMLQQNNPINGAVLLIVLLGLSLFIFSIYSGRYLLNSNKIKLGIILSLINFVLQVVNFRFSGYSLTYSSGIDLIVGVNNGFNFEFGIIRSLFSSSINTDNKDFALSINLASLLIIWILVDIYDELFDNKEHVIQDSDKFINND